MNIRQFMTTDIVTITKETTILEALDLMKEKNMHRLPVVEEGKLIGLLTEGLIQEHSPSKVSSLSMHEMTYLLTKTTVEDIMIKQVMTIHPDDLLEEAAVLMRQNNIKCLPVVEGEILVGIMSQSDLFDAFIELMGYYQEGCRIVVQVEEDHPGVLEQIALIFSEHDLNINQIAVYRIGGKVHVVVQVASLEEDRMNRILTDKGYKVTACQKRSMIRS